MESQRRALHGQVTRARPTLPINDAQPALSINKTDLDRGSDFRSLLTLAGGRASVLEVLLFTVSQNLRIVDRYCRGQLILPFREPVYRRNIARDFYTDENEKGKERA